MSLKNQCPRCSYLNVPQAKFCLECGLALIVSPVTDKFENQVDDSQQIIPIKNHVDTLGDREFLLYIPHIQDSFKFPRHLMLILGRAPKCITPIDRVVDLSEFLDAQEFGISRRHAAISYRDGEYMLQDLGSVNRTKLNGKTLKPEQKYQIYDDDEIMLGTLRLIFRCSKAQQTIPASKKLTDTK